MILSRYVYYAGPLLVALVGTTVFYASVSLTLWETGTPVGSWQPTHYVWSVGSLVCALIFQNLAAMLTKRGHDYIKAGDKQFMASVILAGVAHWSISSYTESLILSLSACLPFTFLTTWRSLLRSDHQAPKT